MMPRPMPSPYLLDALAWPPFMAAPELAEWVMATFIADGATVENPEHDHLKQANIGFLWTSAVNEKRGRLILGQCQLMPPSGDKWTVAAREQQMLDWFGEMPDFLITIFAPTAAEMDDASFMALIEHELSHAAQKIGPDGPMFSRETGKPLWAMRGHSVEEFVGVVRRYGSTSRELTEMVEAIERGPEIAPAMIATACGSCLRVVA